MFLVSLLFQCLQAVKKQILFCKCIGYKVYIVHPFCWHNYMVSFPLTTVLSIHCLHYWLISHRFSNSFQQADVLFSYGCCISSCLLTNSHWFCVQDPYTEPHHPFLAFLRWVWIKHNRPLCTRLPFVLLLWNSCSMPISKAGPFYFLYSITEYQVNIFFNTYPILILFKSGVMFPIPQQSQK